MYTVSSGFVIIDLLRNKNDSQIYSVGNSLLLDPKALIELLLPSYQPLLF